MSIFDFFDKKPKIEFYPIIPSLMETCPPDNGKKDMVNIFKKIKPVKVNKDNPHSSETDIRKCPGIVEYFKAGYIIRTWQDLIIKTDQDGENYNWVSATTTNSFKDTRFNSGDTFDQEILHFDKQFFYEYFPRKGTLKHPLKFFSRWCIKLPKDYGAMMLPVWYDNEERFSVIPGILPAGTVEEINPILYWHELGKETLIKANTPLVKIVPFKMENFDLVVREMSDRDIATHNKFSMLKAKHF